MAALQIWVRSLETKEEIRKRVLKLRKEQSREAWDFGTRQIAETVTAHRWFEEAEYIYCYVDVSGETGTEEIIREAWRRGKTVLLPRVCGDNMEFLPVSSLEELAPGAFGIPEPVEKESDTARMRGKVPFPSERTGLMLLPGVAFDRKKNRVGYGKGYYDRYLKAYPYLHTIAIAFSFQIVEEIPAGAHDIAPELVITERTVL